MQRLRFSDQSALDGAGRRGSTLEGCSSKTLLEHSLRSKGIEKQRITTCSY